MRFLRVSLAFFAFLFCAAAGQAQWANGYSYSGAITVNAGQVPNVDEVNFPVLVSGTYADLATTGNGGKVTSANGYDIIFSSDAAGLNPLKFERESYSPSGQVAFWVQIPSLSHTTNTTFYVFYGNGAVTTDQSTKTGVWDSNYVGVWHLADNAGSTLVSDSTANGNNGTAAANTSAKTTTGKVGGKALSFNGTTDRVTTSVTSGRTFTWEAWLNSGSITGFNYQSIITIDDPSSYLLMDAEAGAASFWAPGTDSLVGFNFAATGLANNTWYHLVFVRAGENSSAGYSVYLNGVLAGQRSTGTWTSASPLSFGYRPSVPGQAFSGALDEIRVSSTARSGNWIAAEYNSENNPSLFYSAVWGLTSGGAGNVFVPNVVGQTQSAASTAITGAGLTVGAITTASSSTVPSGSVISENPSAGTSVPPGSSVGLMVSTGPPNVSVPSVVGQTQSAASTAITGAGLTVGTVTTAISSTVPAGSVISQNPSAGASLAPGSSVSLVVSSGSGYGYFGTITVNASQVPNVDEVNFPVLVSGTYADLATIGNGGKVTSANGYDIIFTSDAAGLNKLKFERESYSPTGQVAFWVQIPNLSHTTNTTFYVFYGNAAVTTEQSTKTAVWDSGYVGVWHLADNAGSTLVSDSTANANNGTAAANTNTKTASGKFGGKALSFNGTTDGVTTNVTSGKTFTWEAWVNSGALSTSQYQSILTIPGTSYMLMDLGGAGGSFWTADAISGPTLGVGGLNNNIWYHLVFVRSGDSATTGYSAYLNGVLTGQRGSGIWSSTSVLAFGSRLDAAGQSFSGALDEIRVSNIARSANWIAAEYNNENNPSLFYTAALGQSAGGGGTTVAVPNVVGQTQSAASTAISGAGLTVGAVTMASSSTVPSGSVISQNPTSGTSVAPGSSVSLVVSTGPANVLVPNVVGQTQSAASTAITGAALSVGAVTTASSSTVPSGSVISQNPTSGTSVAPGSSVSLVVSTGPANVSVPNVVGQTQSAASTAITGAGLAVGSVTTASSSTVPSGSVISETPGAGTSAAPGSAVNLVVSSGPSSGPGGYGFAGTITINASRIPNTDQLNFPVLISGIYPQLATTANGGNVTSPNGYDMIFTSDAAGANRLNFEREYYSPAGQVIFWVQIPVLSHTTNTTFYMFYGNPAVTTDQSTKTTVWDSNYLGVWHMADSAASTLVSDSTANGNNGVAAANTNTKSTAGEVDGALNFNGLSDAVTTNVSSGKTFTWEAWVYSGSMTSTNFQSILTMPGSSYMLMDLTGGKGSVWTSDALEGHSLGIAGLGNNTWYHIAFERSGDSSTTGYSAYVNGILQGQAASGLWTGTSGITFGSRLDYPGQNLTGVLDEVRVSRSARPSDWIATEYNNQSNPAAFYTIDLQQSSNTPPPGGPAVLSVAPSNLFFSAVLGAPNPTLQSLVISSPGGGTLSNWVANASQPWISLPNASGIGAQSISVNTLSATLGLGTYTGIITIVSPGADPPSQTINVTLVVQAPTTYSGGGGTGGQTLYNGIVLPPQWPPVGGATQAYQIPPYISNPPAVVPIDVGRQLFVDDFLIQQSSLVRTPHQPVMYPGNPILSPGSTSPGSQFSDTAHLAFPFSDGVWFDPTLQQFRMWFYCGVGNQVCFASSTDGKSWIRPQVSGAPLNLIDQVLQIGGGRDSDVIWMDLQDANQQRRYKAFAFYPPENMLYWTSPDGLAWTLQSSNILSLQDRTTLFWNPFRSVWVDSMRQQFTVPASTYRESVKSDRMRYYAESPDLSTWTPSNFTNSFWTMADENDPPYYPNGTYPELYNLDAVAYESVMVGLFSFFHPGPDEGTPLGAVGPDLVELGVGFSRDGFYWVRPTRGGGPNNAFIPASNVVGTWNEGNTQSAGGGFLVVGDQLWFYFSGRNGTHSGATTGSTGLATLRRDGFYSMDAGSTPGVLTTRPMRFTGRYMFVNVQDPHGALQIQVLDPNNNNAVLATSSTITTDSTLQAVTWTNVPDLSSFAGRSVVFQFTLTNGALYAFWVSQNTNGASNGYVAAGGPGFTSNLDSVGTASLSAVLPASNTLSVSVPTISLTASLGSNVPPSQHLTITDMGGTLSWTANASPSWITLSSSSGTGVQTISVGANTNGLGAGTYNGTVTIFAPDATPAQLTVNVSLVITP